MILLVEDDLAIGRSIMRGLTSGGLDVRWVRAGAPALALVQTGNVAVVILDLGLPDCDGLDLCRDLRSQGHAMPILMLTARGALEDRLDGFEAGADDDLPKPFAFADLVARVKVLSERASRLRPAPVRFATLTVDPVNRQILRDDAPIEAEPKITVLLAELALARGAVVSRQVLIDAAWGRHAVIAGNSLDVAISTLRRRLGQQAPELAVHAVRGTGFQLVHLIP